MGESYKDQLLDLGVSENYVTRILKDYPSLTELENSVKAEESLPYSKKVNRILIGFVLADKNKETEKSVETKEAPEKETPIPDEPPKSEPESAEAVEEPEKTVSKSKEEVPKFDTNPLMVINTAGYALRFQEGKSVYVLPRRASVPLTAIPKWVLKHPEWKYLRGDKQIIFKPLKSK